MWTYRILFEEDDDDYAFSIVEAYEQVNGTAGFDEDFHSYTSEDAEVDLTAEAVPSGHTLARVEWCLEAMGLAFDKPILRYNEDKMEYEELSLDEVGKIIREKFPNSLTNG